MTKIVLHPTTQRQLQMFMGNPSHALVLSGSRGIGRSTVGLWLISSLLGASDKELSSYPYLRIIAPLKSSISIQNIREINSFLKLKTVGAKKLRRFIIIEQADTMTIEAQNALLKTLEDPPEDTLIILTIESDNTILPTVLSRLQRIRLYSPSKQQLQELFNETPQETFDKAYDMSDGLPGLMNDLITNNQDHSFVMAVEKAKQVLRAKTVFERLKLVENSSKARDDSLLLFKALKRISDLSLKQSAKKENEKNIKRWQTMLVATNYAEASVLKGASTKLALTYLMLHL